MNIAILLLVFATLSQLTGAIPSKGHKHLWYRHYNYNRTCEFLAFDCGDLHRTCLNISQRCNGKIDCPNGADENSCCSHDDRHPNYFYCQGSGLCVAPYRHCDGTYNCNDMSDERICSRLPKPTESPTVKANQQPDSTFPSTTEPATLTPTTTAASSEFAKVLPFDDHWHQNTTKPTKAAHYVMISSISILALFILFGLVGLAFYLHKRQSRSDVIILPMSNISQDPIIDAAPIDNPAFEETVAKNNKSGNLTNVD